jgi:hypothetical protein
MLAYTLAQRAAVQQAVDDVQNWKPDAFKSAQELRESDTISWLAGCNVTCMRADWPSFHLLCPLLRQHRYTKESLQVQHECFGTRTKPLTCFGKARLFAVCETCYYMTEKTSSVAAGFI